MREALPYKLVDVRPGRTKRPLNKTSLERFTKSLYIWNADEHNVKNFCKAPPWKLSYSTRKTPKLNLYNQNSLEFQLRCTHANVMQAVSHSFEKMNSAQAHLFPDAWTSCLASYSPVRKFDQYLYPKILSGIVNHLKNCDPKMLSKLWDLRLRIIFSHCRAPYSPARPSWRAAPRNSWFSSRFSSAASSTRPLPLSKSLL